MHPVCVTKSSTTHTISNMSTSPHLRISFPNLHPSNSRRLTSPYSKRNSVILSKNPATAPMVRNVSLLTVNGRCILYFVLKNGRPECAKTGSNLVTAGTVRDVATNTEKVMMAQTYRINSHQSVYSNTSSSHVQLPFSSFPFSLFFSHFGYSSGIFIHMVFLLSLFSFIYLSLQVSLIFLSAIYLFIFLCYYLFSITQLSSLFYKYNFLIFLDISISTFTFSQTFTYLLLLLLSLLFLFLL